MFEEWKHQKTKAINGPFEKNQDRSEVETFTLFNIALSNIWGRKYYLSTVFNLFTQTTKK